MSQEAPTEEPYRDAMLTSPALPGREIVLRIRRLLVIGARAAARFRGPRAPGHQTAATDPMCGEQARGWART